MYKVHTVPFKYEVKRRFSDFYWLRNILIREYPTVFVVASDQIPPMADKTQRSFEKEYLDKRAEILQQFMDSVVESEVLRSSIQLLCFLKCADENQWVKIKEELEKNLKKTSVASAQQNLQANFSKKLFETKGGLRVEDFENIYGEIQCRITSSLKDYAVELDELIKESEPLYNR